jgi:hypothetical protein
MSINDHAYVYINSSQGYCESARMNMIEISKGRISQSPNLDELELIHNLRILELILNVYDLYFFQNC